MNNYKDFSILIIDKELFSNSLRSQVVKGFIKELEKTGVAAIQAATTEDAKLLATRPEVSCILVSWETVEKKNLGPILEEIKERNPYLPIFLFTEKKSLKQIPPKVFKYIAGYFYLYEDTYQFILGRVIEALDKYIDDVMPPFFKALVKYTEAHKYSWHTPGHSGGTAFLKSPVGRPFYNFFGENAFRADLSVSVPELGSLMEHTDVTGEAEKEAAQTFGSDATYFVLNGTSTANKIIWHSSVSAGDYVLVDRNCHKSLMHIITMIGAIPRYLKPMRNNYGILGPVPLNEIQKQVNDLKKEIGQDFQITVITNSTYDGLCYKVSKISNELENKINVLHLDEAWFAYAHFHPFYTGCYGMGEEQNELTTFTSHSTHKLLAAFSQASMIHVKANKGAPWNKERHERFNEAFMMHTSTSPQYNMIASLDVATKMMKGASGKALLQDIIEEALNFRYLFNQLKEEEKDQWPFRLWQPEDVCREKEEWSMDPKAWTLDPEDDWHGFKGLDDNYVLLDPIKVTILTPGNKEGDQYGIPAFIVSRYLRTKGVVAEKTAMYSFLILFTPGITKGKSGTLLSVFRQFMEDYQANKPLKQLFPDLKYDEDKGLKDFCNEMHKNLQEEDAINLMNAPFEKPPIKEFPEKDMLPADAYKKLVKGEVELVSIEKMVGRISAVMVAPYPPGVPIIMPGEEFNESIARYLQFCKRFDAAFPGFETEIHGLVIDKKANDYQIYCLNKK